MKHAVPALAVLLSFSAASACQAQDLAKAKALQQDMITLDTHLDTPANFSRPGWSILDHHHADEDGTQVDYPRMREGLLDGGFWVVYTGQGPRTAEGNLKARDFGLKRLAEIREMVAAHADKFEIATTAEDAARIKQAGKRIVYISMENAYPLESDPSLLSAYFKQGLRMISLVHTSNNDFADSSTDPKGPEWNGLSPKGEAMVAQANKLGIVLDQSHASDAVFDQMLELSKAPIILSHTASDAVNEHPRNIDDARIRKLAAKGGVIQVNSLSAYIIPTERTPQYQAAMRGLMTQLGGRNPRQLSPAEFKQLAQQRDAINKQFGVRRATFDDYMKHILHIIEVAGPEHVGLGADWDGGGGVAGLDDVSMLPRITQGLLDAGYSQAQIANVWGGNVIRLISQVQAAADPDAVKAVLD